MLVSGTTRTSEPIFSISEVMPSIPQLFFGLSDRNKFSTTTSLTVFRSNFKFESLNFSFSLEKGLLSGSFLILAANFSTFYLKKTLNASVICRLCSGSSINWFSVWILIEILASADPVKSTSLAKEN